MPRARILALPLGFLLAVAIAACGSSDSDDDAATLASPPATTQTAPATTAATTVTTTAQTTTVPATTTTTTSTTPAATTTVPTTPTATSTQPSGGAPAGCPPAVGGFIRDLRATDCGVAREVATAWFGAVHSGTAPDSAIDAAGYSCSGTLAGERASVTCSGGSGPITFTASP